MSDLISRSALINALKIDRACIYSHVFSHVDCDAEEELMIDLVQIINVQPTIEAAPVVERDKVIDEFAEEMKRYIAVEYGLTDISLRDIDRIAEQMKGGAE